MTRRNTPYRSTAFSALPIAARLLCAALLASPLAQAADEDRASRESLRCKAYG